MLLMASERDAKKMRKKRAVKIEGVQWSIRPKACRAPPKASREVRQEMIIFYSRVA